MYKNAKIAWFRRGQQFLHIEQGAFEKKGREIC